MSYTPNNIRFRAVSSKALEAFYANKSFMLTELLDDSKQFSTVARECLLLLYSEYSQWTHFLERVMLKSQVLGSGEIKGLLASKQELEFKCVQIFKTHFNTFKPEFINIWLSTHHHSQVAYDRCLERLENTPSIEAYPAAISGLTNLLQTSLFELYELDCLLGSNLVLDKVTENRCNPDNLVLYVDNFALEYQARYGIFLTAERARIYSQRVIGKAPAIIKNYAADTLIYPGNPLTVCLSEWVDIISLLSEPTGSQKAE